MGGRGASAEVARDMVGQYDITQITDSKSKIVDFYRRVDKDGGIDIREGRIKVSKDISTASRELAQELSERMVYRDTQAAEDYNDIRSMLQGSYALSDQDRADITDYQDYIRSRDNHVRISKTGRSIDSLYQELSSMYPQYFNADRVTHPSEQLRSINDTLNLLRDSRATQLPGEYRQEMAKELQRDLIRGYIAKQMRRRRA